MDKRAESGRADLDVEAVRRDFPILSRRVNGRPLVYLDNAATTQKPRAVIDAIVSFYEEHNANVHRGVHTLSQEATAMHDDARLVVAEFLNAPEPAECVFVRGVTEAINLVAMCWGRTNLQPGEEVLLTDLEHHSNIVPWQLVAEATGAVVRQLPMNGRGELDYERLDEFVTGKTKFVAMQHVSNALGTIHDVKRVVAAAKKVGALVLIDGAQHVGHAATDVREIGCDFYCFSGHKLFGPTGVGVLWGRREVLEQMPPYHGGGDMIESVTWKGTTYAPIPAKFEAGTPDIAGIIGLAAAIRYVESVGWNVIRDQETALLEHATRRMREVQGLRMVGTAENKAGVASFVLEDPPVSALDLGTKLDAQGIAVRTGHHCAQPLMEALGITGTARASFAFYNTLQEVDRFADALHDIVNEAQRNIASKPTTSVVGPNGKVTWPEPKASTPKKAAQALIDDFAFLKEAGEDPRDFILDLGRNLLPMPEGDKNEVTHVKGCMSQVWLTAKPDNGDRLDFLADSDAEIVKGLIGVLQHVFSGQSASAILDFDVQALLRKLDFQNLISVQRRSGVEAMINRIKSLARAAADSPRRHGDTESD